MQVLFQVVPRLSLSSLLKYFKAYERYERYGIFLFLVVISLSYYNTGAYASDVEYEMREEGMANAQ